MIMEINTSMSSSSSTTPKAHHHHHHHNHHHHQEYDLNKNPSPPSSTTNNGGNGITNNQLLLPLPISRSEPNSPYPTTFVQADTSTFKQVVQMLTGSSEPASPKPDPPTPLPKSSFAIPPIKTNQPKRGPNNSFKLYERRNNPNLNHALIINTLLPNAHNYPGISPRNSEILSPSMLDFPKLVLSPVTPLNEDPFNKSPAGNSSPEEEEQRAIAHKGFYLHPSPMSTPRDSEPQLLPLFPVTSPRLSETSS